MNPGIEHTALYSYFNASMKPTEILSELLDNAFDSGADSIQVEITPDGLAVCDNGSGIEDMEKMFRIGASGRHSDATAIGRYGVGGKHALLAVGSCFDIATRRGDKCIEAKVDWMRFAKLGFAPIADPLPVPQDRLRKANSVALSSGWNTRVSVTKKHKRRSMSGVPNILKTMALRYRPALMNGAHITLTTGEDVYDLSDQEYADPEISDITEAQIVINGKTAFVRAGITSKHFPGMTGRLLISYGPRVIEAPTNVGDKNLHSQLYVEVNLTAAWRESLATHKDTVLEDRDELLSEVSRIIEPLADLLADLQRERRFQLVCEGLSNRMTEAVKQLRKEGIQKVKRDFLGSNPVITPLSESGPGNGPEDNPGRPLAQNGTTEEGNNEVERIDAEITDKFPVSFSVIEDKHLGQHCMVNSCISQSGFGASIEVYINTSIPIVENSFNADGDALLLMVAHALAEHFCTTEKEADAERLFPGVLSEAMAWQGYDYRAAMLAGKIITNLSAMDHLTATDFQI